MDKKTLQERFTELDGVLDAMEKPDVSLEDSFALYQKGMQLVKEANESIDRIEKEMQILSEE